MNEKFDIEKNKIEKEALFPIPNDFFNQLESQILTLRSTIITVTPQAENPHRSVGTAHGSNDSPRSGNAPSDQTTATMVTVAAQDFSNLQQEYNKLMFKKHKV